MIKFYCSLRQRQQLGNVQLAGFNAIVYVHQTIDKRAVLVFDLLVLGHFVAVPGIS